ncbi:P-loop containing nucleoside triphosphate hydrolase [Phytophthora cactorum]|nr:P-loop containing nucleoside triphosphate hydrolase [Phytophthora cactorum]
MDTQLPVFSGTLKVHACHLFWTKTPVQLTYHRQDYRHALPVLLIRRPGILGGEFRVPLDPCIHPVRLLPMTKRMASKLEFALEYGWHTKQVRLRAPDAHTYRQWTSLVRAALESGRRPLASCDYTTSAEQPRPDLECSSLASTMDSSSNGTSRFNATIRQRVIEDEQDIQLHLEHDLGRRWHAPSEFFVLHQADYQPGASCGDQDHDVLSQCSIAAVGSCSCDNFRQNIQPARARRRFWPHYEVTSTSTSTGRLSPMNSTSRPASSTSCYDARTNFNTVCLSHSMELLEARVQFVRAGARSARTVRSVAHGQDQAPWSRSELHVGGTVADQQVETVTVDLLQVSSPVAKSVALQMVSRASSHKQKLSEKERTLLTRCIVAMIDGALIHRDALISLPLHGVNTVFRVQKVDGESSKDQGIVKIVAAKTALTVAWEEKKEEAVVKKDMNSAEKMAMVKQDGFSAIGGLQEELKAIREVVEQPLTNPETFERFGLPAPKGVLLFGPPGTGKTLIARALARELNARMFTVNGPEVRDSRVGDMERRLVATLLTLMDGLSGSRQVVVLAATNRPNALDPAVRRPGRFDREVEIGIPRANDRLAILRVALRRLPHKLTNSELQELSSSAHGYVGADLSALCKEAALLALHRAFASNAQSTGAVLADTNSLPPFEVTLSDLKLAMRGIRPSALREISVDVPRVLWSDIGGQDALKQALREAVEWPLQHPEAFTRMGIRPPKGVLLYGPPGCSKTLAAKALATESGMNFIAIKGPELFSKWVGESEQQVREVFRKARAASPTVVFFDEIDALASTRGSGGSSGASDRVLSQLLTELDGLEPLKRVLVVAATNRPDLLDPALMRPGRVDRALYVSPPDVPAREQILQIHTRKTPLASDVSLAELAIATARFSGAELQALCREAALHAVEEDRAAVHVAKRHFVRALSVVTPQIDGRMLAFFERFRDGQRR